MLIPLLFTVAATRGVDLFIGTYTSEKGSQGIYRAHLDEVNGTLSAPVLAAQAENPSFLALAPNGRTLYAVAERNQGEVSAYAVDKRRALTLLNTQPTGGAAPCHVALDPKGENVFVANYGGECLACFPVEGDGRIGAVSCSPTSEGRGPNAKRQTGPHFHAIQVDRECRFAYACDLGSDQILTYRLDPATGTLTPSGATKTVPGAGPRHFAFGKNGRFAYQNDELTNTVTAYAVDPNSGALTPIQTLSTLPEGTTATSHSGEIAVHPDGRWLFVTNRGHDSIASYEIGKDGKLTLVEIAPAEVKEPRGFEVAPNGRWLLVAGQNSDEILLRPFSPEIGRMGGISDRVTLSEPVCIVCAPSK